MFTQPIRSKALSSAVGCHAATRLATHDSSRRRAVASSSGRDSNRGRAPALQVRHQAVAATSTMALGPISGSFALAWTVGLAAINCIDRICVIPGSLPETLHLNQVVLRAARAGMTIVNRSPRMCSQRFQDARVVDQVIRLEGFDPKKMTQVLATGLAGHSQPMAEVSCCHGLPRLRPWRSFPFS